jgi:hypothetical protein
MGILSARARSWSGEIRDSLKGISIFGLARIGRAFM